jgi:hypothetical protein
LHKGYFKYPNYETSLRASGLPCSIFFPYLPYECRVPSVASSTPLSVLPSPLPHPPPSHGYSTMVRPSFLTQLTPPPHSRTQSQPVNRISCSPAQYPFIFPSLRPHRPPFPPIAQPLLRLHSSMITPLCPTFFIVFLKPLSPPASSYIALNPQIFGSSLNYRPTRWDNVFATGKVLVSTAQTCPSGCDYGAFEGPLMKLLFCGNYFTTTTLPSVGGIQPSQR